MRLSHAVADYYGDPYVQQRIREYFGIDDAGMPDAIGMASLRSSDADPIGWERARRRPATDLEAAWAEGADLARSLRAQRHLVFFLELDYDNPDAPGFPFVNPAEAFAQMEPAFRATVDTMAGIGLLPLALVSGRGYHFVGRIPLDAPVIGALADLMPAETPGAAWEGLGCVVEYLAQQVLLAYPGGHVPLVVNGVPVGPGPRGRVAVSIDLSYVGDPLDVRFIRSAFGAYQWHRFRPDIFGADAGAVAPLAEVPRGPLSLEAVLRRGRTLDAARRIARESSTHIPDVTQGVERLVAEYTVSPLRDFHRHFHAGRRSNGPPDVPRDLPNCVAAALRQPNDLLLKPGHLQHLTRTLLARGWEAADVAALVQRSYESNHGWGDRWEWRMEPAQRAAFDVRVFAGLVATGADGLVDFNCVSAQEKGLCPRSGCSHDLRVDRSALLGRTWRH